MINGHYTKQATPQFWKPKVWLENQCKPIRRERANFKFEDAFSAETVLVILVLVILVLVILVLVILVLVILVLVILVLVILVLVVVL